MVDGFYVVVGVFVFVGFGFEEYVYLVVVEGDVFGYVWGGDCLVFVVCWFV